MLSKAPPCLIAGAILRSDMEMTTPGAAKVAREVIYHTRGFKLTTSVCRERDQRSRTDPGDDHDLPVPVIPFLHACILMMRNPRPEPLISQDQNTFPASREMNQNGL